MYNLSPMGSNLEMMGSAHGDDVIRAPGDHPFLNGALTAPGEHEPVARSAIHHRLAAAGAEFEGRRGWLVPVRCPGDGEIGDGKLSDGVWLSDLSHLAVLEVRGGDEPEAGEERVVHRIAPGRWLVLCRREDRLAALEDVRRGAELALDVSGAWTALGVAGPSAPELLRRLTPAAELPAGTAVADVPGRAFVRHDVTWLLVSSEYGQHLWDVATDEGAELGTRAMGIDALARASHDPLLA